MSRPSKTSKRIGIWIQLPPYARWRTEGIGRLTGYIIAGTAHTGVRYDLVAPPWMKEEIQAFIEELPAAAREITRFRTSPFSALRWEAALAGRLEARGRERKPSALRRWLMGVLEQPSYIGLFFGVILLALFKLGSLLNPLNWAKGIMRKLRVRERIKGRVTNSTLAEFVSLSTVIAAETDANARYADSLRGIDSWLVPYPGFTAATRLKKPLTLIFPDFVIADYPERFAPVETARLEKQFSKMVARADRIISFTEDVRTRHVVGVFGAAPQKTAVIKHCLMDISDVWKGPDPSLRTAQSLAYADEVIQAYGRGLLSARKDLRDARMWGALTDKTRFSEMTFGFCPQQARPYKNLPRLVEMAVELNRHRGIPFHLVLSAFVDSNVDTDPLVAAIDRAQAWEFVTLAPGLPSEVHAALYHAADVAIHPSYFEGGLSFIFGEAVSMGTPCLLSRNAANVEGMGDSEIADLLFDPSSAKDLADKVEAVLEDRSTVLQHQRAWMQATNSQRGWEAVALEYLQVMDRAV